MGFCLAVTKLGFRTIFPVRFEEQELTRWRFVISNHRQSRGEEDPKSWLDRNQRMLATGQGYIHARP